MREEMMAERGIEVDHSTINRWVLKYAPELDLRIRPRLLSTNDSWRVDETYLRSCTWLKAYRLTDYSRCEPVRKRHRETSTLCPLMSAILAQAQAHVCRTTNSNASVFTSKTASIALLGLFLEGEGIPLPEHCETISASALSRFRGRVQLT